MEDKIKYKEKLTISCLNVDNSEIIDIMSNTNLLLDWLAYFIPQEKGTVLYCIFKKKSIKILSALLDLCPYELFKIKDPQNCKNIFHFALEEEFCDGFKSLLDHSDDVQFSKDIEGNNELHKWTTYHFTCESCLIALSKHKKYKSEYLTDQNYKGNTPLHTAASEGNLKSCMLLIKYFHFDYKVLGENGNTLLHFAARHNNRKLFELFSNGNIDVAIKNKENETCLTVALGNENFHIAELIVDMGIQINSKDKVLAESLQGISLKLAKQIRTRKSEQDRHVRSSSKPSKHSNKSMPTVLLNVKNGSNSDNNTNNSDNKYEVEISSSARDLRVYNLSGTNPKHTSSKTNLFLSPLSWNTGSSQSNADDLSPSKVTKVSLKTVVCNARQQSSNTTVPCNPTINPFKANRTATSSMKEDVGSFPSVMNSNKSVENLNLGGSPNITQVGTSPPIEWYNIRVQLSNGEVNLNSLINFDYMKSFTTLNIEDIKSLEIIHKAETCSVYKGKYLALPVAVKVYNISKLAEDDMKCFVSEINLLMSLRHPNIITFIGTCLNGSSFYLVTEYMDKKSLKYVLEDKEIELPLSMKLKFCFEISMGLYYLHTRNPMVLHRDIKSSNILVDSSGKVKLCDFGLSRTVEYFTQVHTNSTSTLYWMAPEFISDGLFTDKSDVYSFGILIWEIMMRDTVPYKGKSQFDYIIADRDALKKRPYIPPDFNTDIKELIQLCWHSDWKQRPAIGEVVERLESLMVKYK